MPMNKQELSQKDFSKVLSFSLFEGLSHSLIKELLSQSRVLTLNHREAIYQCGDKTDSFCLVLDGAFKLVRPTAKGDDVIMYFATAGDAIGALLMNKPVAEYPISAKAMGPSSAISIPKATYELYWSKNAEIQKKLNSQLYNRMTVLQDDKALAKAPLNQKIATLLLNLLDRSPVKDELLIYVPLTRQEIADSLGVTVESVIRTMSEWSQRGIIQTHDKKIEIVKFNELVNIIKD